LIFPGKFLLNFSELLFRLPGQCDNFDKLRGSVLSIMRKNPSFNVLDELAPAAQAGDKEEVISCMKKIQRASMKNIRTI